MKKLFLLILLPGMASVNAQKLDGAFKITSAQYGDKSLSKEEISKQQIIKIFKNGYWIAAFFGDPKKPFSGSGGGTYTTANDKYTETLKFYSWDSTAVGDIYTFNYRLNKDQYFQDGHINSEKYPNLIIKETFNKIKTDIPLKEGLLEGAWQLQNATWSETNDGSLKDMDEIKIYSYPRFAWAQYNSKTKHFIGAGGGTYQYDGKKLVEHIEYITYDHLALGTNYEVAVKKLSDGTIQQESLLDGSKETWKRLK